MYFSDSIDEARELARAALNLMALHKVPATPANYAIWYAYQADSNPDLRRGLDRLICSMTEITPARSEEIFGRYFGFESEGAAIRETGERISSAIGRVLAALEAAGRDSGASGDRLASISDGLAEGASPQEIAELIRGIRAETRSMVARGAALEDSLAESAKEMTRLRAHLQNVLQAAMTDSLTGLANRKAFDLRLCEEVAGLWKAGGRLSLLLADIDRFKAFNDSHGHQIGDEVLRAVGRVLKDLVKGRDTPARCGGEAFAVILPDTALADALKIAEQIRARLAGCEPRNLETGEGYGRVTLSLGVAQYRLGEPLGELIQRADRALYRAKRAGRNRVAAESTTEADFNLAG